MASDAVYLANVSSAFLGAIQEAQDMADAGEFGVPLADLLRHARELHEIMMEELHDSSHVVGEHAGGVILDLRERLDKLEKMVADL